jgi:hypothetical protein
VAVVQGNNLQLLGDLAPGVEKPVALQLTNNPNMGGESLAMRIFKSRWNPNSGPEPEVRIPVQLIDSLYGYAPWARPTSPSVLGWLDANPLPMQVSSGRLHHQQLTLVEVSVDVHYGPTVTFPRGWARAEWETTRPDQGSCMTQWAAGTMLTSDILTATLRLPLEVKQLQITQAAIITQVEGPTLDRVVVEVYDWRAGAWTRQAEAPGSADLSEPDRFFHNGELRARLSVGPGGVKGGCVSLDLSAGGRQ